MPPLAVDPPALTQDNRNVEEKFYKEIFWVFSEISSKFATKSSNFIEILLKCFFYQNLDFVLGHSVRSLNNAIMGALFPRRKSFPFTRGMLNDFVKKFARCRGHGTLEDISDLDEDAHLDPTVQRSAGEIGIGVGGCSGDLYSECTTRLLDVGKM